MNNSKLEKLAQAERARQANLDKRIFCCRSTACLSAGADVVQMTLDQTLTNKQGDEQSCEIVGTGCMGLCSHGPLVRVESQEEEPVLYEEVTAVLAKEIIDEHVTTQTDGKKNGRLAFEWWHPPQKRESQSKWYRSKYQKPPPFTKANALHSIAN